MGIKTHCKDGQLTEYMEQENLAAFLDWCCVLWYHVPNESKRSKIAHALMTKRGVKKGVPDNFIYDLPEMPHPKLVGKKGVAIELKRKKGGVLSNEQKWWLQELEKRGWVVKRCNGADEAIKWLIELGYGKRR